MGLEEYTGDITKERNDKEVTLYSKEKKKPTFREGEASSANPLHPTTEDKNCSKKAIYSLLK